MLEASKGATKPSARKRPDTVLSYPLYVARGRRIGCEGATDRLPHGPVSSAQRPLNSEGPRAPLTYTEPEQLPGTPATEEPFAPLLCIELNAICATTA